MAPGGRPRGFDPDSALEAAIDTFWRHGYESTGLAELTAAMNISRPALYRAFGDKAQLFDAALKRYLTRNMTYVDAALTRPTAHEVAEAFLTGNAEAVTTPGRPAGCLSVQAMVTDEAEAFSLLAENRRSIQERLAVRFRQAITDGDLAQDVDADALARFLITLTSGFAIRAADGEPRQALLELARLSLAVFPLMAGSESESMDLTTARDAALEVRRRYEILEQRFNGRTWSRHELMLGFTGDVGYLGRLLLAHDGTWPIDGDADAELKHKIAEALWWVFVLAEDLDIDLDRAFASTMSTIRAGLDDTIARTSPAGTPQTPHEDR